MSSYIMHLCISNMIKEKYNLSDKFMYGSILPDLNKELGESRAKTHYTVETKGKMGIKNLPQIFIAKNKLKDKVEFEVYLGYIAHLIEDYIWFDKYIPSFTKKLNEKEVKYYKDNTVHSLEEYRNDIYSDYKYYGYYVINKYNLDLNKTINNMMCLLNEQEKNILIKNTEINTKIFETPVLITKDCMKKYIKEAYEQVDIFIKEEINNELKSIV